jgi:epoxyqueuosine reductase
MDYLADAPGSVARNLPSRRARMSRATRAAATTTRCCAAALQRLCDRIAAETGDFGYRVFADSAPVMEVELAARAGIGWRGKHTLLLDRQGSWFFLGEIYCDLPLDCDSEMKITAEPASAASRSVRRGRLPRPTSWIARRCISYLTIEHKSAIPENCGRSSATASTAATTASWSAPGTALRACRRN